MKKDLESYIKVYNVLDKKICSEIVKDLKTKTWSEHRFYNYRKKEGVKLSGKKELDTCWGNDQFTHYDHIMKKIWDTLHIYYYKDLNFSWLPGWNGYTQIRFNRYQKNKKMAYHWDCINSMFDGERKGIPTLSIVGNLNENYTGGEFIMFEDKEIKLKTGDFLMFPSTFLYPHKVEPVTKGTRYAFVSWVW